MRNFSTLGRMRRQRRRKFYLGALRWLVFIFLLFLFAVSGYQVGLSQNRAEVVRIEQALAAADATNRDLIEAAAAADERESRTRAKLAARDAAYARDVPRGDLKRLLDQVAAKIEAGVPPDRLALVIEQAGKERDCEDRTETGQLAARTPVSTTVDNSAGFVDNRITVSGEGQPDRDAQGLPTTWFDPLQPVTLHFLMINGEVSAAQGVLPLTHAVVLGEREYLFKAQATERRGMIELTVQSCAFP